jgi:hypothetical protein
MVENQVQDFEEIEIKVGNDEIEMKREGDYITIYLCEYINIYIYPHPKIQNHVVIELDDYLKDTPKLVAINQKYEDLDPNVRNIKDTFEKLKTDKNFLLKIVRLIYRHGVLNDEIHCRRLHDAPTTFRRLCPSKKKEDWKEGESVLNIIYYGNKIEMKFENDQCGLSWVLEKHPTIPDSVILTFMKDGKEMVSVVRDFQYFSVDKEIHNMDDLFDEIKEDAEYYMSYLINTVYTPVDDVKIIDKKDTQAQG